MKTVDWRDWSCAVHVAVQTDEDMHLQAVVSEVRQVMEGVARSADRFHADSDVSRVNAAAGRLVPVSTLTMRLIEVALESARRTGGACDPTVGTALLDAGYVVDFDQLTAVAPVTQPRAPGGDAGRASAGWCAVRVDTALGRVGVRPDGLLDLGATAKAWAVDEAVRRAACATHRAVLVGIGGDVAVAGAGRPWQIDVSEREGEIEQQVRFQHGAVATSSTQRRRWATADGPAHHLIDPRTGRPADGPWRTCSVWAASAVAANEASTAALVLGDDAVDWLTARGAVARLVGQDGAVTRVGGWPAMERRAA